jgi:thiol-disulfide isomerase/thioredoxin
MWRKAIVFILKVFKNWHTQQKKSYSAFHFLSSNIQYSTLTVILILLTFNSYTQSISGRLTLLANQKIKLEGFNGLKTYLISEAHTDNKGNFKLSYSKSDYGVGYLIASDKKHLFVILSGEDIEIEGEGLSKAETIQTIKGKENIWFEKYARELPKREQALSAWDYLDKMYTSDTFFMVQHIPKQAIREEKQRIKDEDASFLNSLPKDSYVSWFLPTRKMVSSVSNVVQNRPKEIPAVLAEFRRMDYTDARLFKSGLFKDAIDNHFWLLQNSGLTLDSMFFEMQTSIDAMMRHLVKDDKKLNEVTDYLFTLLERQSLFQASEYLALKVLNEVNCTIDYNLANQLETYRAMKKGNIAPDMLFEGDNFAPGIVTNFFPKQLSDIKSKYTLVVFGASWCPKCSEELPRLTTLYQKWKTQSIEVVFISLDENKDIYYNFVKNFPFISTCDYQKWNSKIVKEYYVFSTPSMYLLNEKREILLRPNSVKQMDAWVDWYLMQTNK